MYPSLTGALNILIDAVSNTNKKNIKKNKKNVGGANKLTYFIYLFVQDKFFFLILGGDTPFDQRNPGHREEGVLNCCLQTTDIWTLHLYD